VVLPLAAVGLLGRMYLRSDTRLDRVRSTLHLRTA
jgi:hypothetical protein